jgi:DNA-directed RNA polymerase specialized sigma24 family protein
MAKWEDGRSGPKAVLSKQVSEEPDEGVTSPSSLPINDDELFRRATLGDRAALEEYIVRTLPTLQRQLVVACRMMAISTSHAADAAQNAFIALIEQIREADRPAIKNPGGWLHRTGTNLLKNHAKQLHVRVEVEPPQPDSESSNFLDQVEAPRSPGTLEIGTSVFSLIPDASLSHADLEVASKFYRWLTADEREIIEFVLLKVPPKGQNEYQFAGASLGISADAARKRYFRAAARLRDLIKEHG